ncbi:MAG TPA: hypothetical protein VLA91_11550 [Acidimicrobiia bacterium]|nr:hypothetical protein [Acidimicrobiia bacterium]
MSRFDEGRWNRILIWTGAALAWGTALIAARIDEKAQPEPTQPSEGQIASVFHQSALPVAPAQGLVILRFTPTETPEPRVITVEVGRATSPQSPAPAPVVTPPPAPEPSSSGS